MKYSTKYLFLLGAAFIGFAFGLTWLSLKVWSIRPFRELHTDSVILTDTLGKDTSNNKGYFYCTHTMYDSMEYEIPQIKDSAKKKLDHFFWGNHFFKKLTQKDSLLLQIIYAGDTMRQIYKPVGSGYARIVFWGPAVYEHNILYIQGTYSFTDRLW